MPIYILFFLFHSVHFRLAKQWQRGGGIIYYERTNVMGIKICDILKLLAKDKVNLGWPTINDQDKVE